MFCVGDLVLGFKARVFRSVDDECFSSRIRFMLMDAIDLRLNNWVPRQKTLAMTSLSAVQEQAQKVESPFSRNSRPLFSLCE